MSREAMQMALEALELYQSRMSVQRFDEAVIALRQALETEPFEYWNAVEGWVKIDEVREHFDAVGCGTIYKSAGEGRSPLYTAPPAREWVGLTDDEVEYPHPPAKPPVYATAQNTKSVRDGYEMGGYEKEPGYYSEEQLDEFARAIEQALKEKNT